MPCGLPFFRSATMASCKQPTTAYSLWQCARSGTVHAVASSFAFHPWFPATHRSPRAQPMRHRLTTSFSSTQCKESCAVAAVYAALNDGHRSISRLSARSTATHADRCLSARPRNGSPSTSGRDWTTTHPPETVVPQKLDWPGSEPSFVLKNTTFRASALSQTRTLYETTFQNAC